MNIFRQRVGCGEGGNPYHNNLLRGPVEVHHNGAYLFISNAGGLLAVDADVYVVDDRAWKRLSPSHSWSHKYDNNRSQ